MLWRNPTLRPQDGLTPPRGSLSGTPANMSEEQTDDLLGRSSLQFDLRTQAEKKKI